MIITPLRRVLLCFWGLECMVDVEHGQMIAVGMGKEGLHFIGSLAGRRRASEDLWDRQ